MLLRDPKQRFTDTVEFFEKYRPSYPQDVIKILTENCGLNKKSIIADIGSGTGKLSALFIEHGNKVFAVEPNDAMRQQAETIFDNNKLFSSINGSAETTGLPDKSVDIITAGQSFHWFDSVQTRKEFKRILKPKGWVALIWNMRPQDASIFMDEYDQLLEEYGTDYHQTAVEKVVTDGMIEKFFKPSKMQHDLVEQIQQYDWDMFRGRLLSTSYTPKKGESGYKEMLLAARDIFKEYQKDGIVDFLYETKVYMGQLA